MNYKNNDDDHIKNFFCIMLKQKVLWSLKNKAIKRFKSLDRYDLIVMVKQQNNEFNAFSLQSFYKEWIYLKIKMNGNS